MPHAGPYLDELRRLYASPGAIWMWNREYDFPRQVRAELMTERDSTRVVDLMWLWHFLQSDVPRGLGFVAPFYSSYGPWKHLSDETGTLRARDTVIIAGSIYQTSRRDVDSDAVTKLTEVCAVIGRGLRASRLPSPRASTRASSAGNRRAHCSPPDAEGGLAPLR